jgi:hypothetical protein
VLGQPEGVDDLRGGRQQGHQAHAPILPGQS